MRRKLLKTTLLILSIFFALMLTACGNKHYHSWGEWEETVPPTCEDSGKRVRKCTDCGEEQEVDVSALMHKFEVYTSNNDANCSKNATETSKCTNCDETHTREIEDSKNLSVHTSTETRYQQSTKNSAKHDKIYTCCNAIVETVDHRWGEGKPDSVSQGVTVYTCQDCGATKKQAGEGHVHNATKIDAKAENCTSFGNIAYWYCAGCDTCFADQALKNEITKESTRISPAHIGGTATCISGPICTRCNTAYGTSDPNAHRDDSGRVDGTVTVYTCQDCHRENRVPNGAHVHNIIHVPARQANCPERGNIEYWYCDSCLKYYADEALTNEISAQDIYDDEGGNHQGYIYEINTLDSTRHDKKYECCGNLVATEAHSFTELLYSYAASCRNDGYDLYACVCGETKQEITTPATEHSVNDWSLKNTTPKDGVNCTYTQEWEGRCFNCRQMATRTTEAVIHSYSATITQYPTCVATGTKTYQCSCGATPEENATEIIPAIPDAHNWDEGTTNGNITTYSCTNCNAVKSAIVTTGTSTTINNTDLSGNEVILNGVSLQLDSTVCGALESGEVALSAAPVDNTTRENAINALPDEVRAQIDENTPILDFSLIQDSENVDFNGGKIRITMEYDLPEGANTDCVVVLHIDGENVTYHPAEYYEIDGQGYVTFEAEHFSIYMPGVASAKNTCETYRHIWSMKLTEPTCTARGFTEYYCQRCGESKIDDVLYPTGHLYETTHEILATCLSTGTRTHKCEICDDEFTVTLPITEHNMRMTDSRPATCTEGGYKEFRECQTPGCDEIEIIGEQKALGHGNYSPISAELIGMTCTDGVKVTYKCSNDDDCSYTIEKIVYNHINEYDFPVNRVASDYREPFKIWLGEYLTEAGISYSPFDHPYIELKGGCLCREEIGIINLVDYERLFNRSGQICDWKWKLESKEYYINDSFVLRFTPQTDKDNCHYTESMKIEIGTRDNPQAYAEPIIQPIKNYIEHSKTTIQSGVYDDSITTCYDKKTGDSNVTIQKHCSVCSELLSERVLDSWYHYYATEEKYENEFGFEVYIHTCICGNVKCDTGSSKQYELGVVGVTCGDKLTFTSTGKYIDNNYNYVRIYTGTYGEEKFIYAIEDIRVKNSETCEYSDFDILYLDCESAENYKNCAKRVECIAATGTQCYPSHHSVTTDVEGNECLRETVITRDCGCGKEDAVTTQISFNTEKHNPTKTETVDSKGNKTVEYVCENCGFYEVTVTNSNGEEISYYIESPVYPDNDNFKDYILYTTYDEYYGNKNYYYVYTRLMYELNRYGYKQLSPYLERVDLYSDSSRKEVVYWRESVETYHTTTTQDEGCLNILTGLTTSSLGEYSFYQDKLNICNWGTPEEKMPNCEEDGYYRCECQTCGFKVNEIRPAFGHPHSFGDYEYLEYPTCISNGTARHYCYNCDYSEIVSVEPTQHECYGEYRPISRNGVDIEYITIYTCSHCEIQIFDNFYTGWTYPVNMYSGHQDSDDIVVIHYTNINNPNNNGIDGTYKIVMRTKWMLEEPIDGFASALKVDENGEFVYVTLNVNVTDNGNGTLTINRAELDAEVEDAMESYDNLNEPYLVLTCSDGSEIHIRI